MKKIIRKLCMFIAKTPIISKIFYAPPFNKIMYKIHSWSCTKTEYQNDLFDILDSYYDV